MDRSKRDFSTPQADTPQERSEEEASACSARNDGGHKVGAKKKLEARLVEVEGALVAEEREVGEDVRLDFLRDGSGVDGLKFGDDLGDGVPAVAAFDDFQAGAVEAQGALRHQQGARLLIQIA
jgi:hypothetical protein